MLSEEIYNEQELIEQLSEGNEFAFSTIYNLFWDKLYFLAYKHLKSSQATEDIIQDVFLSLWYKRDSLHIQSLPAYLAAMTRYSVYKYIAKLKKAAETSTPENVLIANSSAQQIEDGCLLDIIEKLSNTLPEKCRMVFVYNKLLDQPLNKVADELNISLKTAEAHLTKALKKIREILGDKLPTFLSF